jgi:hypothetical protein
VDPTPPQASWLAALDAIADDGRTVATANHFSLGASCAMR